MIDDLRLYPMHASIPVELIHISRPQPTLVVAPMRDPLLSLTNGLDAFRRVFSEPLPKSNLFDLVTR